VLWVAPGIDPVSAEPPPDLTDEPHVRMPERRVVARPELTLEDGYDSGERLGLGAAEAEAYAEIAEVLRQGQPALSYEPTSRQWDDAPAWDDDDDEFEFESERDSDEAWPVEADDWVLGVVTGVQGQQPQEGTALLLHLGSFEFQDGGAIQFRIPEAALAARDWASIYAEGDSG
jgi:hypothetical protein